MCHAVPAMCNISPAWVLRRGRVELYERLQRINRHLWQDETAIPTFFLNKSGRAQHTDDRPAVADAG